MAQIVPFSTRGRFWRGNLHTHSTRSDGLETPERVAAAYRRAGYDFLMISDHFLERYDWPVTDTAGLRADGFTTLIGAEIHAPSTSTGDLWHILAAGLPLDFPKAAPGETGPRLAARAREAGAFIGMAHPQWSLLGIADGHALDEAHAVEIYNHGCAVDYERGDGWYLLDQLLNDGKRLGAIATDDAHFKSQDQFGGWVHVKAESLDPVALLHALKAGHYYASTGPVIHNVEIAGTELHVTCSPVDTIVAATGYTKFSRRMGRALTEATFDLSKFRRSSSDPNSAWFRISLIDRQRNRAWTNPIWWDELG